MIIRTAKTLLTPDEYLLKEREAEFKSEYRDGHINSVEKYIRQSDNWILNVFSSLDDLLQISSIGCKLAVKAIYAKVVF